MLQQMDTPRAVRYGLGDLLPIVNNVDDETAAIIDVEPYAPEAFTNDMSQITAGRSYPQLSIDPRWETRIPR